MKSIGKFVGVCFLTWCLLVASTSQACNTPVYRYAMYNWSSSPYFVFYLSHGEPTEEDKAVNQLLTDLGSGEEMPLANVFLEMVDLDEEEQLERLPTRVKEACAALKDDQVPTHMIWTAWGAHLATERLTEKDVQALVESPIRKKLGEMLLEGQMTIFMLLTCEDKEQNLAAEKAVQELITRVATGEMPLEEPPLEPIPGEEPSDEDAAAEANRLEIGMVKLSREDPAEKWLVRMLMTVESDLEELADEPMVFGVYGRGRAMEPYVGKGITADNLTELLAFLGGACSCQVKEQNPGADLLMRWDWEETAEQMAANDPTLEDEYDQFPYQEYPVEEEPDELKTDEPESSSEKPDDLDDSETSDPEAGTNTEDASNTNSTSNTIDASSTEGTESTQDVPVVPETPEDDLTFSEQPVSSVTSTPGSDTPRVRSFAPRMLWILGIGFLVVTLVLAAIGWMVLRKA